MGPVCCPHMEKNWPVFSHFFHLPQPLGPCTSFTPRSSFFTARLKFHVFSGSFWDSVSPLEFSAFSEVYITLRCWEKCVRQWACCRQAFSTMAPLFIVDCLSSPGMTTQCLLTSANGPWDKSPPAQNHCWSVIFTYQAIWCVRLCTDLIQGHSPLSYLYLPLLLFTPGFWAHLGLCFTFTKHFKLFTGQVINTYCFFYPLPHIIQRGKYYHCLLTDRHRRLKICVQ